MANVFSNMVNSFGDFMASKIAPYLQDALGKRSSILADYYTGDHRPQLKTRVGQSDDNVVSNYIGLAVDRSVSRLFRGGVEFNLPEGADKQEEWLEKAWDLNNKEILLYQVGLHGAVYGTPYIKICPDELVDPFTLKTYPRLIALDPEIVRIVTDPADMNEIIEYRIEYQIMKTDARGVAQATGYREITRPSKPEDSQEPEAAEMAGQTWVVEEWEQSATYGNQWTLVSTTPWPYNFPPIIHWKNLPSLKSCYGDSEIDDVINVQDKENFTTSNIGKIIKFHAHPQTIVSGVTVKQLGEGMIDSGPTTMTAIPADAKAYNLEMSSNLQASSEFAASLRNTIFDIAREVDMSGASTKDRLGALTNFGLKILFSDALDKNDTKRQLYGAALKELNRRLMVLNNWEGEDTQPGEIKWQDPLPVNISEEMGADKLALDMGIIDKETVAARYMTRYGVDWETIQANLAEQGSAANANNADIGAQILRNFTQGKGAAVPTAQPGQTQPGNMMQGKQMPAGQTPDQTGGMQ